MVQYIDLDSLIIIRIASRCKGRTGDEVHEGGGRGGGMTGGVGSGWEGNSITYEAYKNSYSEKLLMINFISKNHPLELQLKYYCRPESN